MRAAQGYAALHGRKYVLPDDVKRMVFPVLSHRIILNEEGKLRGELPERILEDIILQIPVPA
jgi:MoxR-like ATPase